MSDSRLLRNIVDPVRRLYAKDLSEPERWRRIGDVLEAVLADPELQAAAQSWPKSHDRTNNRYTNLLFYEDPGSASSPTAASTPKPVTPTTTPAPTKFLTTSEHSTCLRRS